MPTTCNKDVNGKHAAPTDLELLCFEILNHYHNRLFTSHEKLLEHITITQKDPKGQILWVGFDVPFHSHMIKVALMLCDKPPLPMAKWAMFVFILEVLNCIAAEDFFVQKSGAEKPHHNNKERTHRYIPRKEEGLHYQPPCLRKCACTRKGTGAGCRTTHYSHNR